MSQGTQGEQARQGQDGQGDASLLLGVQGLAVRQVKLDGFGVRWVHLVTDTDAAPACPECGVISTSAKGSAATHPRDLGYGPTPIRLVWQRKWRCREVSCARVSFTECLPAVPAEARLTTRLRRGVQSRHRRRVLPRVRGGNPPRLDRRIAHAPFIAHVDPILDEPLPQVTVLGSMRPGGAGQNGSRTRTRTSDSSVLSGGTPGSSTLRHWWPAGARRGPHRGPGDRVAASPAAGVARRGQSHSRSTCPPPKLGPWSTPCPTRCWWPTCGHGRSDPRATANCAQPQGPTRARTGRRRPPARQPHRHR